MTKAQEKREKEEQKSKTEELQAIKDGGDNKEEGEGRSSYGMLSALDDEALAKNAVEYGVEDYEGMERQELIDAIYKKAGYKDAVEETEESNDQDEEGEGDVHPFDIFAPLGDKIVDNLKASSFESLEALAIAPDEDLVAIKGIGQKSVNNIRGLLATAFSDDEDGEDRSNQIPKAGQPLHGDVKVQTRADELAEEEGDDKIRLTCNIFNPSPKLRGIIGQVIQGGDDDWPEKIVETLVEREEAK